MYPSMFSKITNSFKEFFGKENEFIESVDIAVQERITSPFYGYFIVSWIVLNWKIIYIAFFVNQEKIIEKTNLLRHEYLSSSFPLYLSWKHFWLFLIYPFVLTTLFFWLFPYITRFFYRKSLKNQKKLKIIEIQETRQQRKEEKKLIREETQLIKEKAEKQKEVKKVEKDNPEILWQQEFNEFIKHTSFNDLGKIKDIVYSNGGKIFKYNISGPNHRLISSDGLATSHLKGLILLKGSGIDETLELTEKGKFFIVKYIDHKDYYDF